MDMHIVKGDICMTKAIGIDWKKGYLTEREISLIKLRKNRGEKIDLSPTYDANNKGYGFDLEKGQIKKGYDWLMNLYKSPKGKIRINCPYGYREIHVLETFEKITLVDFYDSGNSWVKFYVPYYRVIGKDNTFEYCVYGGVIHILG